MKVLFAYIRRSDDDQVIYERMTACTPQGLTVVPFPLNCARQRWPDLDRNWRTREPKLLAMYEALHEAVGDCDAMMLYNGWSLHPEFVAQLPAFSVYCFFDDPESSEKQSRHLAPAFDAVLFGNIASRPQYESWGCERIAHLPILFDPAAVPPRAEIERSLDGRRDNDIVLCCGMTTWRRRRLEGLIGAFPDARVHGSGWPAGWITREGKLDLYRRSKIGWNIHNSTGPINQRLLMLPAWGIMQVCDNKTGLGMYYDLDREVAGFDTIPEAIDLTRHFLDRDDDRHELAAAALDRFHRDYHPTKVWARIARQLREWMPTPAKATPPAPIHLSRSSRAAAPIRGLQRAATRWALRQAESAHKTAHRVRFGHEPHELDESIYRGHWPAYRPGARPRRAGPRAGRVVVGHPEDAAHLEALSWALTSLIGDATTIVACGRASGPICRARLPRPCPYAASSCRSRRRVVR